MSQLIRVLLVEDSDDDAQLLLRVVRRAEYEVNYQRVDNADELKGALKQQNWDLVVSDYVMPGFNGLDALALCKAAGLDAPFIVVSGQIGEDLAVAAMKA